MAIIVLLVIVGLGLAGAAALMAWGRTRPVPTAGQLVGKRAIVVTSVPADGFGEVRVRVSGQPLKLFARATKPITLGAAVVVTQALNDTSVVVTEE